MRYVFLFLLATLVETPPLLADDVDEKRPRLIITQPGDESKKLKSVDELIDSAGMTQRRFRKALTSWEGGEIGLFGIAWYDVIGPIDVNSPTIQIQIDDQDLLRLQTERIVPVVCDPVPCLVGFKRESFLDKSLERRIRSCEFRLVINDERIESIEFENRGCRFNKNELREFSRPKADSSS